MSEINLNARQKILEQCIWDCIGTYNSYGKSKTKYNKLKSKISNAYNYSYNKTNPQQEVELVDTQKGGDEYNSTKRGEEIQEVMRYFLQKNPLDLGNYKFSSGVYDSLKLGVTSSANTAYNTGKSFGNSIYNTGKSFKNSISKFGNSLRNKSKGGKYKKRTCKKRR